MIIHKNFMTSQRNMNPYKGFLKHEQRQSGRVFVRSKSDQVEISDEAQKVYENKHVVELEKARNKKIASEYLPDVIKTIGRDGDLRNVIRLDKLAEAKSKAGFGMLFWDNDAVLKIAAESVSAFL